MPLVMPIALRTALLLLLLGLIACAPSSTPLPEPEVLADGVVSGTKITTNGFGGWPATYIYFTDRPPLILGGRWALQVGKHYRIARLPDGELQVILVTD